LLNAHAGSASGPARAARAGDSAAPAPQTTIGRMPQNPDRVWRLQGATNFRDLGGYPGHGGRPLRWRRLFALITWAA